MLLRIVVLPEPEWFLLLLQLFLLAVVQQQRFSRTLSGKIHPLADHRFPKNLKPASVDLCKVI